MPSNNTHKLEVKLEASSNLESLEVTVLVNVKCTTARLSR